MTMPSPDDVAGQLAGGLLALSKVMEPIQETVDGYRANCLSRGYTAETAESMALDLHRGLQQWWWASMAKHGAA